MSKNSTQPKTVNSIARQIKTAHTYNRSRINHQTAANFESANNDKSWI